MEGFTHHTVLDDAFGGDMFGTLSEARLAEMRRAAEERRSSWSDEEKEEWPRIWKRWQHGYDLLRQTDRPVLEMWGDRGRPTPSRELLQIPERENIELCWIRNASHSFIEEYPEETARIVSAFIQRIEAA
jgi:pimeloyl-ACP methyl ester carboxylesterase